MWSAASDKACVAEVLRRTAEFAPWRADRLRLPIRPSRTLKEDDMVRSSPFSLTRTERTPRALAQIQCFHDAHTGFHDWVQIDHCGRLHFVHWQERPGVQFPPAIATLGQLLDAYPELRINNSTATFRPLSRGVQHVSEGLEVDDETWVGKSDRECLVELLRRCSAQPFLRFRLPPKTRRTKPRLGDVLQLFQDCVTGFSTLATFHVDLKTGFHFVKVYRDEPAPLGSRTSTDPAASCIEISLGEVLDQHPEIRVYASGDPASSSAISC